AAPGGGGPRAPAAQADREQRDKDEGDEKPGPVAGAGEVPRDAPPFRGDGRRATPRRPEATNIRRLRVARAGIHRGIVVPPTCRRSPGAADRRCRRLTPLVPSILE